MTSSKGKKTKKAKKEPVQEKDRVDFGCGLARIEAESLSLEEITLKINAESGNDAIMLPARNSTSPSLLRRPFGIPRLDGAIYGGMPAGGLTQTAAKDGVGKNALAAAAMAANQYIYGNESKIVVCWLELPADKDHMRINSVVVPNSDAELELEAQHRVRAGKLPMSEEFIAERKRQIGEIAIIGSGTAGERLDVVVDVVALNAAQLVIVDSVSAITTRYHTDTSLENDPRRGAVAFVQTEFMRKLWNAFSAPVQGRGPHNLTTVLALNQARANQNRTSEYDPEWDAAGAYALKHGKLIDIHLKHVARLTKTVNKKKIRVGKTVGWDIAKGKAGCHEGAKGEVNYYYVSGFDVVADLITGLKEQDMLVDRNKTVDVADLNGEIILDGAPHGKNLAAFAELLRDERDVFWKLYYAYLGKVGASCLHRLSPQ